MPLFRYQGLNEQGGRGEGTIEAESLAEAKQKIFRSATFLLKIEELQKNSKPLLKKEEVLHFTRELGRLLKAGLPLYESLSAMEEKYRGQRGQRLLLELCEQVKSGQSFSRALGNHPHTFDFLYVAMVENAEKTGRLQIALEELGTLLSRQSLVKKQLINALLYPTFLLCFCLVVIGALLFYVIPSMEELFEGRELQTFTRVVFTVSQWARHMKGWLLLSLPLLTATLLAFRLNPRWQRAWHSHWVQWPVVRHLFAKVGLIRFCRSASTLLEGGVPIVAAFAQARGTLRHPILERIVAEAELAISQGTSIQFAFKNQPLIPPLVPRMLGIAQEGGNLGATMRQIAEIYEEELERSLSYFSSIIQPVLLLFLGMVVGFVILSVLIPLTDVSSFAT